jgi:tRNA (guanine37-N1)-methyltransferase
MDKTLEILHDEKTTPFPLNAMPNAKISKTLKELGCQIKKNLEISVREHKITFEEKLKEILTKEEQEDQILSYDWLGDIAILEIREELQKKKNKIVKALLDSNKLIKTVYMKKSAMKGEFRVRELELIGGKKNPIAKYRENGATIRFDVTKSYFSTRLSFERKRISELVKPKERILALFAGVGPFPLVIAKKVKNVEIIAIELNPDAVADMKQNIKLNKLEKQITALEADVKIELKKEKYQKWADRITMPLPHTAELFLEDAIPCAKKGGIIHFYTFASKNDGAFNEPLKKIQEACQKTKRKFEITSKRIVRPYAPYVVQVVIDFKITN